MSEFDAKLSERKKNPLKYKFYLVPVALLINLVPEYTAEICLVANFFAIFLFFFLFFKYRIGLLTSVTNKLEMSEGKVTINSVVVNCRVKIGVT